METFLPDDVLGKLISFDFLGSRMNGNIPPRWVATLNATVF